MTLKRVYLGFSIFFLFWGFCFAAKQPTELPDLAVIFIHRDLPLPSWKGLVEIRDGVPALTPEAPEIKERWPAPLKQVSFIANVSNLGHARSPAATGIWKLDGANKKKAEIPQLSPLENFSCDFQWDWEIGAHEITFELSFETTGTKEISSENNALSIRSDALPFRFYVNQLVLQAFRKTGNHLGTYNFSDWLQAHVALFNAGLKNSRYPGAPDGCLQQIFVDRILVYNSLAELDALRKEFDPTAHGALIFEPHDALSKWARAWDFHLMRELLLQLGMPDLRNLDIEPEENLIPDKNGSPLYWRYVHEPLIFQIPGGEYRFSEFCVLALNKTYGRPRGFTGDFMYDMPEEFAFRLLDRAGEPIEQARIRIFQKKIEGGFDPEPFFDAYSDPKGFVKLPNRPAPSVSTPMGFSQRNNPFGNIDLHARNGLFLIEIRARDQIDYIWKNITEFNLTYWKEMMDTRWRDYPVYSLPLILHTSVPAKNAPSAPAHFRGSLVKPNIAAFQWLPPLRGDPDRYRLYSSSHAPGVSTGVFNPVEEVSARESSMENILFPQRDMYYAITAVDSLERDGPFSSWLYLPYCPRLKRVAFSNEDHAYVYDEKTNRVLRLDDKGFFLPFHLFPRDEKGAIPRVSSLVWSPLNELVACIGEKNRIDFYKPDGSLSSSFGVPGKKPGEMLNPFDAAFNKKREMAIADRGNRRVQIFDLKGKYLGRLGEAYIDEPIAVAFSPEGHLHVLDAAKKTCLVFHEKAPHKFYYEYSYGNFKNPVDILITNTGVIHVSDQELQAILIFSSNGRLLSVHRPEPVGYFGYVNPQGVALDSKGRVIYVDQASSRVRALENIGE